MFLDKQWLGNFDKFLKKMKKKSQLYNKLQMALKSVLKHKKKTPSTSKDFKKFKSWLKNFISMDICTSTYLCQILSVKMKNYN